ncbi:MAG: SDR family oxidoreductase [Anaerolineales bacterium]
MRVLVFGGNGMLGHQLCRILDGRMEVWATFRDEPDRFDFLPAPRRIGNVTVEDTARVGEVLDSVQPAAVINAVGIVKQRDEAKQAVPSIRVNALFPHQLADLCAGRGIRVLQISTDCVFSGLRGAYTEDDVPDPVDLYGRSKLLGELNRPGCLTLRTSIIGWQLNTYSSLLSWFALQRGKRIQGYRKAVYSGVSTSVLAALIGDIIENQADLQGLYHVASKPITKYDLLIRLRDALGWKAVSIEPDETFSCDRSLNGDKFSQATGWHAPGWDAMLAGLAREWPAYEQWYDAIQRKE